MKTVNLVFVLAIAFTLFLVCASGVASALSTKYVGNTVVDLSWSQYWYPDFSKYEICRNGSQINTTTNRSATFYRDSGLAKGVTHKYEIKVYNTKGEKVYSDTTSAKTGEVHGTMNMFNIVWIAPHILQPRAT